MIWARFSHNNDVKFGQVEGGAIAVFEGDMFDNPKPSGETLKLDDVTLLIPCVPGKMLCLWNNYHALAAKMDVAEPDEPLYFFKAPSSYMADGGIVRRPKSYDGPVVYEGELGIVIGKECCEISEEQASDHIFGYTCINDVTAAKIISRDPTFAQWTRAKSFDTFGVFGPMIATGIDPLGLSIKTVLNGDVRQDYPVSDIIFPPHKLVAVLSHDMTLLPGDVIACGTSVGVGSMKEPSNDVSVTIEGIGTLANTFVQ